MHLMSLPFLPFPFFAPADGEGGDGGDGGTQGDGGEGGEGGDGGPKMGFQPAKQGEGSGAGEGGEGGESGAGEGGEDGEGGDRPEWLKDKYKTVEDQAKAYNDLFSRFSKKTDDLKAEVMEEVKENYAKELGVPDEIDGYEYPENVNPPGEELDQSLRTWAKENNVSPEGFQQLVDMYAKTIADPAAEFEKLGSQEEAQGKIDTANRFASKMFDEADHGTIDRIMQTADGVEFMNRLSSKLSESGVFSDSGAGNTGGKPMSRDEIRAMQADPRYGQDDAYTAQVQAAWDTFVKLPPEKRK